MNVNVPFLVGGGSMGALMRSLDWSATPLGDPAAWPQSLRSAVSIMLNSRYPIALYWGPELALLYNDAWSAIPGGKHPWALGRPGREVWPEIWETIGPLYDKVRMTGEGIWQEDELLPMHRHGYLEECYYNFTFSPIRGEQGSIDGIFNAVVETTDRVLSERRLRTLSRMGERANPSLSIEDACVRVADILAENRADVPFALVYLREEEGLRRVAGSGTNGATANLPSYVARNEMASAPYAFADAAAKQHAVVHPAAPAAGFISDYWHEPIVELVTIPIMAAGDDEPAAYLVAGANPRRRVDISYRSFFELAAGHVGTALASARAYEDERQRACALAEIDKAKTAFFSNVSHEFRTPLTLMLGPLEDALAQAGADDPQRSHLELAHRNALRLLRLVNALLDFSRIEAGRVEATFAPVDLAALTGDLASSFRAATDRAGLRLIVDAPPLSGPVHVDATMWEKIVLNLVSNAFKFTLEGEIDVTIVEDDGNAVLTVRDTGVGIPSSEIPHLFDRFHRVEGAKGRSFEGSGIGLALVAELVKQHGGRIEVESEEGAGTLFRVLIPIGTSHLPQDRLRTASIDRSNASLALGFVEEAMRWLPDGDDAGMVEDAGGEVRDAYGTADQASATILLVDDNADLRDYISRLLRGAGYVVQTAEDGQAALEKLERALPDLIVTDVMMPRLDGLGLLSRVRSAEAWRELPVIMLSARAGEESKLDGLHAGADDYLTKPFSARELLARVSANIKLARLRRESAEAARRSEQELREFNATLERKVEEALAERRLMAHLVEQTDAFVQVADMDFRWLAINRAAADEFERIFGRRPEIGESMLDLLDDMPEHQAAVHAVWARALAGEEFTETQEFGDQGRDRRSYEMKYHVLRDTDGRQIGAYQFVYDVTQRVREQERLAEAEEQLQQAQKMEAMGQLTGGVAHDFNNLLAPIVGALDLLQRKGIGDERDRRLIEGAAKSAERAKTLVQRLLAFARRQPLQPRAVDVGDLIRGMADLIASTTGPQIRVAVDLPEELPAANADPNQLELALLNLAVNARDAMPDGGTLRIGAISHRIRSRSDDGLSPGDYLCVSVADTGVGMDEATLARAIEPFFSTKGIGKGTGLGLSMVHGLARQLGGAMRIHSKLGLGTNIELLLPVTQTAIERDAAGTIETNSKTSSRGTALLVDDEDLVRESTAAMLADLGLSVIEAESGEEALRLLQWGLKPDLLLTDHLMPGLNGTDLVRRARQDHPGLRVLLVSGYAESEGVAPDLPRLIKPFRQDELATCLARIGALD